MVATRKLKVLYFDGSSAAKMWGGPMDMQDVLIWDGVQKNRTYDEENRIRDLCNWGEKYGIDGYVRMEMDFEMMICNFARGLEVVSFLNIPSVNGDVLPPPPPRTPAFRVLETGRWHDNRPGETRVRLDYTRIVSFYDTSLFPALHESRKKTGAVGPQSRVHYTR
jgi:hypothetical protein